LAEHDLLLVAAREPVDEDGRSWRLDAKRRDDVEDGRAFFPNLDHAHAAEPAQRRERQVLANGQGEDETLVLPVLGREGESMLDGAFRRGDMYRPSFERHPARYLASRVVAKDRLQQLGPPGAHQPGDAKDLAASQGEADVVQRTPVS